MDGFRRLGRTQPTRLIMSNSGKRRIVNAHHHLWDLGACDYPWLMARGVVRFFGDPSPIQKNYLVEDLRDDAGDYELDASVHVQVGVAEGADLEETGWLQELGDKHGLPSAIVAFCELDKTDAADQIAAQLAYSRVRGMRQVIGRSDAEDAVTGSGQLVDSPIWRENLELLGELGLSFDLQLTPSDACLARTSRLINCIGATPRCGEPLRRSRPA